MTTLTGTNGDDVLGPLVADGSPDFYYGLGGNDILSGSSDNDSLDGGTGNDTMSGAGGTNIYQVDSANDVVNTTTGNDTILISTNTPISYDMSAKATNTKNITLFQTFSVINHNVTGNNLANYIIGNNGSNTLNGLGGNDTIYGNGGNDTIDGGTGNDVMNGGAGNDTFVVDSASDQVQEGVGLGTDEVFSTVSYTLDSNATTGNVENLTLTGAGADINGTGNNLNNTITGTTGSNRLDGGTGNDILIGGGGAGGDSFVIDNVADRVIADGIGDYAGNPTPTGEGVNTIFSSVNGVSLVVGANVVQSGNVYNLILTGTGAINGTGNALGNYIAGNSAANTIDGDDANDFLYGNGGNDTILGGNGSDIIDGGAGADTMTGGAGSDAFYVDNSGDIITDGNVNDSVYTSINGYSLLTSAPGVLYLNLIGTSPINGTGNNLDNRIIGNSSDNVLSGGVGNDSLFGMAGIDVLVGGAGNDILNGGAGNDFFSFDNSVPFAQLGTDSLADFTAGDKFYLSKTVFGLSTSVNSFILASEFAIVSDSTLAATSTAKIVYNSSQGQLIYNQNGIASGFGTGGTFADLTNPAGINPSLTASAIFVIA